MHIWKVTYREPNTRWNIVTHVQGTSMAEAQALFESQVQQTFGLEVIGVQRLPTTLSMKVLRIASDLGMRVQ